MRTGLLCLMLTLAAPISVPDRAMAAELVMFETDGCLYCVRWKQEVGRYYTRTVEGRRAPLRIVNLRENRPADLRGIRGVALTPTFVLVEKGRELGRITGYPGQRAFWAMLERIMGRSRR